MGQAWICVTCATQYPPADSPPAECLICRDERQYVGWEGQQWTTLEGLRRVHTNALIEKEPNLYSIEMNPKFGIGQRALLVRTSGGNLLWDCVALLDESTIAAVEDLGGIAAIAISHPHYYSTMIEWSRAFGDVPIYIHEFDRRWVVRPESCVVFWEGETRALLKDLVLIRTGGHFEGYQVAHWAAGAKGRGVLLSGDQPYVAMNRRTVSFMYSYPNLIPLGPEEVRHIAKCLQPLRFDRVYSAFPGLELVSDGHRIVQDSALRYLRAIGHERGKASRSAAD